MPLLTLLGFVVEYALRRLLLARYMDYTPAEFLRRMLRIDLHRAFTDPP